MRSSNPALRDWIFDIAAGADEGVMTMEGTVNKSIALFLMALATASYPL